MTEARLAIDKYKDFNAGLQALKKISPEGQQIPIISLYMAKAYEGLNDTKNALQYYQKYAKQTPMTAELMEKIADLNYQTKKNNLDGSLWYSEENPEKNKKTLY